MLHPFVIATILLIGIPHSPAGHPSELTYPSSIVNEHIKLSSNRPLKNSPVLLAARRNVAACYEICVYFHSVCTGGTQNKTPEEKVAIAQNCGAASTRCELSCDQRNRERIPPKGYTGPKFRCNKISKYNCEHQKKLWDDGVR